MNEFHDIFSELKRDGLTAAEKARMRNDLQLFMSEHPVSAPMRIRMADTAARWSDLLTSHNFAHTFARMRFAPVALALVLFIGIGTSYAAESALPGDPLYAVKINLNEPIRGALAVSQASKAQWNVEQVSRRLVEAEKLATMDRLTPVARTQIELAINESVHAFDENVSALAKESANPVAVAAARSDLEASLLDHEHVLSTLAANQPTTTPELAPIIENVRARSLALRDGQGDVQGDGRSDGKGDGKGRESADVATIAVKAPASKKPAADTIRAAATLRAMNDSEATVAATTSPSPETHQAARQAIDQAEQDFSEGKYGKAFTGFRAAIESLQTGQPIEATSSTSSIERAPGNTAD